MRPEGHLCHSGAEKGAWHGDGTFKVFSCFPHFIAVAMDTSVWNKLASPNSLQVSFTPFVAADQWSLGASLQAVSCEQQEISA